MIPAGLFETSQGGMFTVNTHRPQECVHKPGNMHLALYTWHSSSLYNRPPPPPAPLLPSHSMWDKSITRWREEAHSWGRAREREGGRQVDVSRCQDIQDSRPPPVTMIMITVSDTDGAMATVAIRWKPCIPQMSTLRSSFAFSLPVPGSHTSAQNHNPFIKKKNVCKECNVQSSKTAPRCEGWANTGHRIDRSTRAYISLTNHD